MAITAEMVKNLREATGAGLMDCRKALTESNGDVAEAEKILKKMGLAAVAKRSDRATENGRVEIAEGKNASSIVSISCETDFVARNEQFAALCKDIAQYVADNGVSAVDDTIDGKVKALISTIKENMAVKKIVCVKLAANEATAGYIHADGAMGALVKFKADKKEAFGKPELKEFMHDIALHVTAFQPTFLDESKIDAKYKAEQEEIFKAQVATLDKPEKVKEGIVRGKYAKLVDEVTLLGQGYIKDPSISVANKLKEVSKAVGANVAITDFYFIKAGV